MEPQGNRDTFGRRRKCARVSVPAAAGRGQSGGAALGSGEMGQPVRCLRYRAGVASIYDVPRLECSSDSIAYRRADGQTREPSGTGRPHPARTDRDGRWPRHQSSAAAGGGAEASGLTGRYRPGREKLPPVHLRTLASTGGRQNRRRTQNAFGSRTLLCHLASFPTPLPGILRLLPHASFGQVSAFGFTRGFADTLSSVIIERFPSPPSPNDSVSPGV